MHIASGNWKLVAAAGLLAAAWPPVGVAQTTPPVTLQVDIENMVQYFGDTSDPSKFATNPNPTSATSRTFEAAILMADIVAVNGSPAKGTWVARFQVVPLRTTASPSLAIADVVRSGPGDESYEILQPDGTPIGTIVSLGLFGGAPPPGTPAALTTGNHAVVGGTGAFSGIRGEDGGGTPILPARNASFSEDPASRRVNGGGKMRFTLHLVPLTRPEIVSTAGEPAIFHSSDFRLVTADNPAAAGEMLSLIATGLGPVRPGLDPGNPFPTDPLAVVNSPVEVTVNGAPAEVLGAVGYPGSVDAYRVDFRIPSGARSGSAAVQLTAAWIPSSSISIVVQ